MSIIFLIIFIILLLLFIVTVRVNFIFNTDQNLIQLSFTWLYPFIRGTVDINTSKPILKVYCLKLLLYNKSLQFKQKPGKKKRPMKNWISMMNPEDVYVDASYGFNDPFSTGILCGTVGGILEWFKNVTYQLNPDFVPSREYIDVSITGKINIGKALLRASKLRTQS